MWNTRDASKISMKPSSIFQEEVVIPKPTNEIKSSLSKVPFLRSKGEAVASIQQKIKQNKMLHDVKIMNVWGNDKLAEQAIEDVKRQ